MMKAQFMSLWDGLDTDYNCQVSPGGAGTRDGIPPAGIVCLELLGSRDGQRVFTCRGFPALHGNRGELYPQIVVLSEEIGLVLVLVLIKKWHFQMRWDGL